MKLTSTREFRKGRVLYNPSIHTAALLVSSPHPKRWNIALFDVDGSSSTIRSLLSEVPSDTLKMGYSEWQPRLPESLPNRVAHDQAYEAINKKFGVLPSDAWRIRRALRYTPSPVTSASPVKATTYVDESSGAILKDEDDSTVEPKTAPRARTTSFQTPKKVEAPYWYESDADRKLLRDFINLRQAAFTVNLMISGPSGSGKTVGVQRLGEELGMPVHIVNCQAITTPEKWLGQIMADPSKGTYFEPSQHLRWVERDHPDCEGHEWCILLYDEITRLRPDLNNMTYSLFDTQRGIEVPQMGRRVLMDERNIIISTANIGAAYAGTFGQDKAFRERFAMTMERDFPPLAEEVKIITSATSVDKDNAKVLAKVAQSSREMWRNGEINDPISTRSLVTWALLVAGGYDVMAAAEYTILPLYSEDGGVDSDRAKIRLHLEGKAA